MRSRVGLTIGLVVVVLATLVTFTAMNRQDEGRQRIALSRESIEINYSPSCDCCKKYKDYLKGLGFSVKSVETEDLETVKGSLGIPRSLWSCHTARLHQYFIEGHVPVEAIQKLLEEQPRIDGIALSGMPAGSPGMGGDKTGPFVIYSISGGTVKEFMRI